MLQETAADTVMRSISSFIRLAIYKVSSSLMDAWQGQKVVNYLMTNEFNTRGQYAVSELIYKL